MRLMVEFFLLFSDERMQRRVSESQRKEGYYRMQTSISQESNRWSASNKTSKETAKKKIF